MYIKSKIVHHKLHLNLGVKNDIYFFKLCLLILEIYFFKPLNSSMG